LTAPEVAGASGAGWLEVLVEEPPQPETSIRQVAERPSMHGRPRAIARAPAAFTKPSPSTA
jgi:hypothetical protein